MSDQFELLEDIADQSSAAPNAGTTLVKYLPKRRGRRLSVSPAFTRAKVARPPKDPPAPAACAPGAVSAPAEPTADVARIVTSRAELVAALRARKEFLDLSHDGIDALIGWADRYSSKVLSPRPRKGLSGGTLQLVLQALGLGVVAIVLLEDPDQTAKMRRRWVARQNFGPRPATDGALLDPRAETMVASTTENNDVKTPHQLPPEA
ncbi:hypothetical protein ACNJX9_17805 [Bradyrhizobium sp. DASA03076]|uniref:hypothetical protein n=1 Tax=Bradyrhizobium sp. BLXBL-03 TaxID=3395916 RepID=UPI003F717C43